jgi:hypothetical protein
MNEVMMEIEVEYLEFGRIGKDRLPLSRFVKGWEVR